MPYLISNTELKKYVVTNGYIPLHT